MRTVSLDGKYPYGYATNITTSTNTNGSIFYTPTNIKTGIVTKTISDVETQTQGFYTSVKIDDFVIPRDEDRKEGKKMLETKKILSLYMNKRKDEIREKYSEMKKKHREKDGLMVSCTNIIDECNKKLEELYQSQFNNKDKNIDKNNLKLLKNDEDFSSLVFVNPLFKDEKIKEFEKQEQEELTNLNKLIEEVNAMLEICSSRAEILEVLKNYNIVDNKGKLV